MACVDTDADMNVDMDMDIVTNSQRLTRLAGALLIGCLGTEEAGQATFFLCLFCAAALVIAKRLSATFTTRCCN